MSAAASIEGGLATPQFVVNASVSICLAATAPRSARPCPICTQKRPLRPSSTWPPGVVPQVGTVAAHVHGELRALPRLGLGEVRDEVTTSSVADVAHVENPRSTWAVHGLHRILQVSEVPERVRAPPVPDQLREVFVDRASDLGRAGEVLVLLLPQPRERVAHVDAEPLLTSSDSRRRRGTRSPRRRRPIPSASRPARSPRRPAAACLPTCGCRGSRASRR